MWNVSISPLYSSSLEPEPITNTSPKITSKEPEPASGTENTFLVNNELRVYIRRNKNQGEKALASDKPCHESAPAPGTQKFTGNETSIPATDIDNELSIVLRKGTRTCTKHSIQDYISFGKLSSEHHTIVCRLDSNLPDSNSP